ncbi:phosphatidylinositol N-acetylglucosaminyltransferase subunit A-like protein, partial [Trifolium pratense]
SLTEAFCIAILEAASCGLLTVSTRVGGVPEVVPDDMIVLAEPDPSDMVRSIQKAITMLPNIDPQVMHNRMRELYSWHDVAKRTKIVYDRALKCPDQNLLESLSRKDLLLGYDIQFFVMASTGTMADDIEEAPDVILSRNCDGLEGCCRKHNNAENHKNSSDTNNIHDKNNIS